MPRPSYRYPWPASAINSADMAVLHSVRENSEHRVPISLLVARAVRACYGQALQAQAQPQPRPPQERILQSSCPSPHPPFPSRNPEYAEMPVKSTKYRETRGRLFGFLCSRGLSRVAGDE